MKITSILIGGSVIVAAGTQYQRDKWDIASVCAQRYGHNMNDGILQYEDHPTFISDVATVFRNGVYDNELVEICLWFDILLEGWENYNHDMSIPAGLNIRNSLRGIKIMNARAPCLRGFCSPISVARASSRVILEAGAICRRDDLTNETLRDKCREIGPIDAYIT